jgi:hypothetical protein
MRFNAELSAEKKTGKMPQVVSKKVKAPGWITRGLHSEGGGGRGLTAWDAVCYL